MSNNYPKSKTFWFILLTILTHWFFNFISGPEEKTGSLKMNLVLRKQSSLVYKLESLNFKAEAGTEQINQFITILLDFISIVVKPNDFSAINGLHEIKKINKSPKMEIESTYSSDIFDDSQIDDGKTTSNFSKIKIDLYNRLTEQLFKTETFKKMGAYSENFNPPIFSLHKKWKWL